MLTSCNYGSSSQSEWPKTPEELRNKAEQGLITSIECVKEICKLAKEAEKELEELIQEKTPQAALTELFPELKQTKRQLQLNAL